MTDRAKTPLSLSACTKLPADLEEKLKSHPGRKEKKVKASASGFGIMLFGFGAIAATFWLASRPTVPDLKVLAGGALLGVAIVAYGGLVADPETFGPALAGLTRYVLRLKPKS